MARIGIKICGISDRASLDAAIGAGADHIGLVFFAKSPRNVGIEQAAALAHHAAGRAKIVGLFVDPEGDFLGQIRQNVHLDVIQLHGKESPARVAQVMAAQSLPVWKAIGVRKSADLDAARDYQGVARILFDAKPPEGADLPGGTGLRIDWSLMAGYRHSIPWILAGGLDPRNVGEAIHATGADFVDVSSGVESAPGVKDAARIAAFCKAVRAAG
ncbi:phosphoribosylanthranilate isomerase [Novosphingobium sp. SG751A]|uniref:phosphoribosylanthranilate isomerase n=1 Tax=Novosphingobium sp. SG751A TaxID=2587000 RepID=UPI00155582BC|nr:phosphoribosylanthranilate isomerase [Novosphingobium sp. SG751A]NOW46588.1 phosphoribosylanthranilate isomerase [Novosphingobium sp. SG751A]